MTRRPEKTMKMEQVLHQVLLDHNTCNLFVACAVKHVRRNLYLYIPPIPTYTFNSAPAAKKGKKGKEPEAPVLYDDPPDKMTSKDGRSANMKITSWNVDGLRAWVKKNGLDVNLGTGKP